MRAVRYTQYKTFPTIEEVERPQPGPGEVLLKIAGAGACHSDVAVYNEMDEGAPGAIPPAFTLGHESSGWVEEVGEGVTGFTKGDAYLVYGPIGCKHCKACSRGQDTYCENVAEVGYLATGLGRDGGMAEYMTVPATNLIPSRMPTPSMPHPSQTRGSRRTTRSNSLFLRFRAAAKASSSSGSVGSASSACRSSSRSPARRSLPPT
jgi:alcohol dehydrogenase, propanol-preferring